MASPVWPAAVRLGIVHVAQSGLVGVTAISRRVASVQRVLGDVARARERVSVTFSLSFSSCLRRESATWIHPRESESLGRRGRNTLAGDGAAAAWASPSRHFNWRERKVARKCRVSYHRVNGQPFVCCHVGIGRSVLSVPIVVGTTTSLSSFVEDLCICAPRRPPSRIVVAAAAADGRKRAEVVDAQGGGAVNRRGGKREGGQGGEEAETPKLTGRQAGAGRSKKRDRPAAQQGGLIDLAANARELVAHPQIVSSPSTRGRRWKSSASAAQASAAVPAAAEVSPSPTPASARRYKKADGGNGNALSGKDRAAAAAGRPTPSLSRQCREQGQLRTGGRSAETAVAQRQLKQAKGLHEWLQETPPRPRVLNGRMERKQVRAADNGGDGGGGRYGGEGGGNGGRGSVIPVMTASAPAFPAVPKSPPPSLPKLAEAPAAGGSVAEIKSFIKAKLKKRKKLTPETEARLELDQWSKWGDLLSALSCFDRVRSEGKVPLLQYHYNVLLHLCASAAAGTLPRGRRESKRLKVSSAATDGSVGSDRSIAAADAANGGVDVPTLTTDLAGATWSRREGDPRTVRAGQANEERLMSSNYNNASNGVSGTSCSPSPLDSAATSVGSEESSSPSLPSSCLTGAAAAQAQEARMGEEGDVGMAVLSSEELAKLGMERGFELYNYMLEGGIKPNEATFTSMARLAAAKGDGDLAFSLIKQMADVGILPRLRSYQPALKAYRDEGSAEKAWEVYEHMNSYEVEPSESDLCALLDVSARKGHDGKVYAVLHRLRTSVKTIRPEAAEVVEGWFRSKAAEAAGGKNVGGGEEREVVKGKMEETGGGWHGLGWLGEGEWVVQRTSVSEEGVCAACGEQLASIDLDPIETVKFAQAVADLAMKREGKPNEFIRFQEWLNTNGPFDAVVDGANVGLFNSPGGRAFIYKQVHVVMNAMREISPSGKLPLLMLHNRRVVGAPGEQEMAREAFDRYKEANVLYATPTGSNDDWYWLFAAVKMGAFLITNDEMRDHLFQLLGDNYFPKWKERHQVRFSVVSSVPKFYMPPPFSTCIQESAYGGWHLPITNQEEITELEKLKEQSSLPGASSSPREWVCARRPRLSAAKDAEPMDWSNGRCSHGEAVSGVTNGVIINSMHAETGRNATNTSGAVEPH